MGQGSVWVFSNGTQLLFVRDSRLMMHHSTQSLSMHLINQRVVWIRVNKIRVRSEEFE